MTPGAVEQIKAEAGATVREEALIDVGTQASYTAFMPPYVVPAPDVTQNYSWLFFTWRLAEQSMKDVLVRGGFSFDTTGLEEGDPLARTAAEYEALLDTGLSAVEASETLGIRADEVTQRLSDRTLYGVSADDGWRILEFQLEEGRPLPGLEEVLPLLHEELNPVAVYRWFVSPNVDLTVGEDSFSPRQWLLSGRNVAVVARIAIDL